MTNHDHEDDAIAEKPDETTDEIWVRDFDDDAAQNFCTQLLQVSKRDPRRPIIVYIDSLGGAVHALMAMVAVMDAVPNQIVTACMGKAFSAGAYLLSHGDLRFATSRARIMLHESSAVAFGHIHDLKVDAKEIEFLNEEVLALLAENCDKSIDSVRRLFSNKRRDVYMGAVAAKRFGIIDRIGIPSVKKTVRYDVL